MRSKKEIELLEALEVAAAEAGFDLVDLEFAGSGRSALLRVYINRDEGLNLDDIANANTWISEVIEKLDPYKGSYTLEVSSPGIDRVLRTWKHFEQALGEEATISLESDGSANQARLKYTGVITSLDPGKKLIMLEAEGCTYPLEFERIKKARIKGRLDFINGKDD